MPLTTSPSRPRRHPDPRLRYDPWLDLRMNWPSVELRIEAMRGDLLGQVRAGGALIALRSGTSLAQRRCTLAHEIVHLERGLFNSGRWQAREETIVHTEAARRLIRLHHLADAIRQLNGDDDPGGLAQLLDVDQETLHLRLQRLDRTERAQLDSALRHHDDLWRVA